MMGIALWILVEPKGEMFPLVSAGQVEISTMTKTERERERERDRDV